MSLRLAILLTALLSGCSARTGLTYRTEEGNPAVSSSLALQADRPAGALGLVEVSGLVGLLIKSELLETFPPAELADGQPYLCTPHTRVKDVIRALEIRMQWVYDPSSKAFYDARATHSVDNPDAFGRLSSDDPATLTRRPALALSFRFQNRSGGISASINGNVTAGATVGGVGRTVELVALDGVRTAWQDSESRTYFEGVRDPTGEADREVSTNLKSVASGVSVDVLAARLPGNGFRIDGTISFSSFTGEGLGQKTLSVPLQLDGPRHQWLQIFASEGSDRQLQAAMNPFTASGAFGQDSVFVLIRID